MAQTPQQMDERRARKALGLGGPADARTLRAAFHRAVKAAHPDRPGGDAARLREVVAAYALLKQQPAEAAVVAAPAPAPLPPQTLEISPALAAAGGEAMASLADGRRLKIAVPPGLRPGDRLRAGDTVLTIAVRAQDDMVLRGDDLWLTQALPGDAPNGGRLPVETPAGLRQVWVDRQALARGMVRLTGLGMPARGRHLAGDLFVRLRPAARPESGARSRLRAFEQAWAT
jgi:curved DNA-binding protein